MPLQLFSSETSLGKNKVLQQKSTAPYTWEPRNLKQLKVLVENQFVLTLFLRKDLRSIYLNATLVSATMFAQRVTFCQGKRQVSKTFNHS